MSLIGPRRVFAAFFVGTLLVQLAWILTVPTFRGIDEFDHVYKAAAVARGQWTAPEAALNGRGGVVTISGDIVRAASRVCDYYDYTGHDNCHPIRSVGHGDVEVATAAGAYNPAYYLIVGTIARPFDGEAANYVMRAVTAVICALMIAWAAAIIARWASTAWPLVTFTIALTPVMLYSTAITAPNGVTFASAALLWSALIGLARTRTDTRGLALPLALGSVTLVATHTTGAMWLALTLLVVVLLRPFREWVAVLRPRWTVWAVVALTVTTVTVLCAAWIRFANTNSLGGTTLEEGPFPWGRLPVFHLLWTLQAVAVFPMRNDPAPIPVYVIWGLPLAVLVVVLFRSARARERLAAGTAVVLLAAVPTVLTVLSFETQSAAWQGRYSLPLWLGITSMAGLVADRRSAEPTAMIRRSLFVLLAVAMTISTVYVGRHEVAEGPTDPAAASFPGGFVLVGLLTAIGMLLPLGLLELRSRGLVSAPGPAPSPGAGVTTDADLRSAGSLKGP